jgi:hypothetical protein
LEEIESEDVFNEQEKEVIKKEFTFGTSDRFNRNNGNLLIGGLSDEAMPSDCFTIQNLDSTKNSLLRNATTKSVILAPFNSTKTHSTMQDEEFKIHAKEHKIRFHARVREIDRQYERNNNCELDNGVYNKCN